MHLDIILGLKGYWLLVAGCGLRVARCGLMVDGCALRVADNIEAEFEILEEDKYGCFPEYLIYLVMKQFYRMGKIF
jgi:hypothetical protein